MQQTETKRFIDEAFARFYDIGALAAGGVTRLGYSAEEDAMHGVLRGLAEEAGFAVETDEVGNLFVRNFAGEGPYTLLMSHLDSVVSGGRYDGVAGVVAGVAVMRRLREMGASVPVKTVAFRAEESAAFVRKFSIGSSLVTGVLPASEAAQLVSSHGGPLPDIFAARGYRLDPPIITGMQRCIELHIEQGRVLWDSGEHIGIVTAIAAPRRYQISILGRADHSGATPMSLRCDALAGAAEMVLAIEAVGRAEAACGSVTTVGRIQNVPNAMNTVPGETKLSVDTRSVSRDSLDRMEAAIRAAARDIAACRGLTAEVECVDSGTPVALSLPLAAALDDAATRLGIPHRRMVSGAGHDCMHFAPLCDTALVFVPCWEGISHNPLERAEHGPIAEGVALIASYLAGEA